MIMWLKKTDGGCARLSDPWKPRIHVSGDYRDLLDLACRPGFETSSFVEMFERAGDRDRSRVLEVEVDGEREATGLAKRIEQSGRYSKFRFYDVDVPAPQMYLYKKNLFPLAFVVAEETSHGVIWKLNDSRDSIDYQLPPLKIAKFEITTRKTRKIQSFEDKLESACLIDDQKKALVIDRGDETDK